MSALDPLPNLRQRLERGIAQFQAGHLGEAAEAFRSILQEVPDQPDALHMMGAVAFRLGKFDLALNLYDEAVKSVPSFALAWSNRALILRVLGRNTEALASGRKAIACDPKLADGWDITGLMLRERHQYAASLEHHARAVALNPANSNMRNNYAIALATLGRFGEGYAAANAAIQSDPNFAVGYLTKANILGSAGWPDRSIEFYRKAIALDPALEKAVGSEGRALALMGALAEGFAKMDRGNELPPRFAHIPLWTGEKVKHLLLFAEQGAGDIVHFLRYIPLMRERVEELTVEVPLAMLRFVRAQIPDATVISTKDERASFDAFLPLMSLARLFNTNLNNIPAPIPYIKVAESWALPWRAKLKSLPRPLIGIVWKGNPLYNNDLNRSMDFEDVRPILDLARPHLVSFQKGSTTAEKSHAAIFDADEGLEDFASSVGLMSELDLVVGCDTGMAHFAGALGKPVWTLLPFAPDWRWFMQREDSPWYPTMRLFRQTKPNDWSAPVAHLACELKRFLAGDGDVLKPKVWEGSLPQRNPNALPLA